MLNTEIQLWPEPVGVACGGINCVKEVALLVISFKKSVIYGN